MSHYEDDEEVQQKMAQVAPCSLQELGGSSRWMAHHQSVVWLSLKAVRQTAQFREETVYAAFMASNKIPLLVEDVITIEVWRQEILRPFLRDKTSLSPIIVYSILYHEGCLVTLLELMLYHSSACEALADAVVDLIDYCHRTLGRCIAESRVSSPLGDALSDHPSLKHLDVGHLESSIAIRCIAILRYISGHADNLSEIVTSRMLTTTDVPVMAVQLLETQPWIRRKGDTDHYEIYDNGQWLPAPAVPTSAALHPVAAHLWLIILQLLMSPAAPRKYDLNDFRCQQLLKLRGHLNQVILDQIPVLAHLEQWLIQLSLGGSSMVWQNQNRKKMFVLEMVAEIQQRIMFQLEQNRQQILDQQRHLLDHETDQLLQQLAVTYDPENLEATLNVCSPVPSQTNPKKDDQDPPMTLCVHCNRRAMLRCSRCRQQHYCSKECQLQDWPRHRVKCKAAVTYARGGHKFKSDP